MHLRTTRSIRCRGTLDLLVLRALKWAPRHGYAVAQFIPDGSGGELWAIRRRPVHIPSQTRRTWAGRLRAGDVRKRQASAVLPADGCGATFTAGGD